MKKQEIILLVNNLSVGLGGRDIIINEENNVLRLPHLCISTPNSNNSEIDSLLYLLQMVGAKEDRDGLDDNINR